MKKFYLFMFLSFMNISFSKSNVYEDLARATGGSVQHSSKEDFLKSVNDGKNRYNFLKNATPIIYQNLKLADLKELSVTFPIDDAAFGALVVEVIGADAAAVTINLSNSKESKVVALKESGDPALPVQVHFTDRQVFIIPKPINGKWTANFKATAFEGQLLVRIQSKILLDKAEFIRMGGRPGHQGLFPYLGLLKSNDHELMKISMYGNIDKNLSLELISDDGTVLSQARPNQIDGDNVYHAKVLIPNKPFRVMIRGLGFQRTFEKQFSPSAK